MRWFELARRQGGVISRAQARSAGLSDGQIARLIRSGQWIATGSAGVFVVAAAPWTADRPCWSAVLGSRGVLSHMTAAERWGLDVPGDGDVHVTVWRRLRTRMPAGVRVHRVALPLCAVAELDGIAITTRERSVLDSVGVLPVKTARELSDRALHRGWIRLSDIERRLVQKRGRWGNRQIGLLYREVSGAAAASERLLHKLLSDAGIEGWRPNAKLRIGSVDFEVDVLFAEQLLVIEVDGFAYHVDVARFRADRRKQNMLVAAGWTVLRFTWADLVERPHYVVTTIRALLSRGFGQPWAAGDQG